MSDRTPTITALGRRVLRRVFSAASWDPWFALLSAAFALPMTAAQLETFRNLTGRTEAPTAASLPRECWWICGRRAGKSFIAALAAIYLTCCRTYRASPGERLTFMVIASDRRQARVVKGYIAGLMRESPALASLIADETKESIELTNGIVIEVKTASWKSLRGFTVVGAICDEVAFWDSEDSANPDAEILAALRPAMATVPGALLLVISSPYARRGELWRMYREHFGKNDDPILVAQAPTTLMNPTVPQDFIDEAYRDDPERASAEFGAQFRSDLEACFSREALAAATIPGRVELPLASGEAAFVDPAGGSGADSMTLAIARREGEKAVLVSIVERRPPFSPERVVEDFATLLRERRISSVCGDRYAGEWPREQFRKHGITYDVSERTKSDIYRELVPLVNSQRVELLDVPRLLGQLATLDRRTGRGGKDAIDHAPNAHDDVANAAAGALVLVGAQTSEAFGLLAEDDERPITTRMWGRQQQLGRVFHVPDTEER